MTTLLSCFLILISNRLINAFKPDLTRNYDVPHIFVGVITNFDPYADGFPMIVSLQEKILTNLIKTMVRAVFHIDLLYSNKHFS